jgi:hypothetical protein
MLTVGMNVEFNSIEFLMQTVTSNNGFTMKFIDAVEEVVWEAERAQNLLTENEKLKKVLLQIAHGDTHVAYPHDIAAWALGLDKDKQ